MLNLKNPLVVFDLETTGTNTSKDRIVEIALIKIFPVMVRQKKSVGVSTQEYPFQ